MKYLLIILLFFSCKQKPFYTEKIVHDTTTIKVVDTFYVPNFDTVYTHFDTVYIDNCKPVIDSLKHELFMAKYKIERVKYYLKITQRNPSQTKFLKSWINRAVN